MPYRRGDYSLVIDSSFRPYSFQEMLQPLAMYKDEYEKLEDVYVGLQDKADKFKYLADNLDPNSKAAQIYNSYANDLKAQADDFAKNGLSINNRRALTNLRRRYQGEIGQLYDAKEMLDKELDLRRQAAAKDPSMLYNTDNLSIDSYLGGAQPNLYGISGNYLYSKGAAVGKAASSRMYTAGEEGSTLGGYYKIWKDTRGVRGADVSEFMSSEEVQKEVDRILEAEGALGNLSGANLEKARQQVLNGIYTGIVYEESVKPVRDPGVPSWSERRADARAERSQVVSEAMNGISWKDGKPVYDKGNDLTLQRQLSAIQERAAAKAAAGGSGSGKGGSSYGAINQQGIRVEWKGNNPNDLNEDADDDVEVAPLDKDSSYIGVPYEYDDLPQYAKNKVDKIIGNKGNYDNYIYYFRPYEGGLFNDTEAAIDVVPKKVIKDDVEEEEGFDYTIQ